MRYAVVQNGMVVNVAVATPDYAASQGWIECPAGVGVGWIFDSTGEPLPPPPDTEGQAARIRSERDAKLTASDVAVLPDRWAIMTTEQQTAWATYRQALRDITEQTGFPWEVQWPQEPQ